MALSNFQVLQCIAAVQGDVNAADRIRSVFSVFGRHAGFARNATMVVSNAVETLTRGCARVTQGLVSVGMSEVSRWQVHSLGGKLMDDRPNMFDPDTKGTPGYELQCTEIALASVLAIETRQKRTANFVPDLKLVEALPRFEGYDHAGVRLTMQDGTRYALDWWATLDIDNPLIYKWDDFYNDRKDAAREFKVFGGFS